MSNPITFDLNAQYELSEDLSAARVICEERLRRHAPMVDVVTYVTQGFNPIQGGEGIYGSHFQIGAKVGF